MIKKLLGPLVIVVALITVIVLVKNKPRPETKATASKESITVLITPISPENHPLIIPAEGFVNSRWQTTLSSQVSGQVVAVSDQLLVGNQFNQGDVLVTINPLDYEVQYARAQANLRSAEANLVEQKMQSERARSDWNKLNPNRKPSDFNLRLPQLKSAESNLQAAKDELRLAQENLNRTQIKAPFDGFSVVRNIDIGEQLSMGGVVAEIVDRKNLELKMALTLSQASLIEQAEDTSFSWTSSTPSKQTNTNNNFNVSNMRFEPFVDNQNRWRSLILELDSEQLNPLVGEFLSLSITTNQANKMLAVPESALSIDGRIWYVDTDNTVQFFMPETIYKDSGTLFLVVNNELTYPIDVVVSPPNSLLRGTGVNTDLWQATDMIEQ